MDFGSNGVAISLIGNMYYNFTPNISAFTGVEYKYNMYQIKHKLSNSIFMPETRTKMDLLFKLGTRFKVKENFKVSPYVILGMGYGSVKQETQYYSSNETTYENITDYLIKFFAMADIDENAVFTIIINKESGLITDTYNE